MNKKQIKEYEELASILNGKTRKQIEGIKDNLIKDMFNWDDEYVDIMTKSFTLTYYFESKKLQEEDIYLWNKEGDEYKLVNYKGLGE